MLPVDSQEKKPPFEAAFFVKVKRIKVSIADC